MRRHVKASSAGSTLSQGNAFGSLILGAFVARGASSDADGSGAPTGRRALLALLVIGILACSIGTASAAVTHPYTGVSFGPGGVASSEIFSNAESIAIDPGTGAVFVYAAAEGGSVFKFSATGEPLKFSGLPGNEIEGIGGNFATGEYQIAVAPPGSPAGTSGDIYVANNKVVKIFAPSGEALGVITNEETCGVATDPSGHVFVGTFSEPSRVTEYVPTSNPPTNADQTRVSSTALPGICNVAADSLGNVYAAEYSGNGVVKLEGMEAGSTVPLGRGGTMAVNFATNDLYLDRENHVAQYDSAGNLLGISAANEIFFSYGIAINSSTDRLYVSDKLTNRVKIFGPQIVVPAVSAEPPSPIKVREATIRGSVNPAGTAVTECKVEYGTTKAYGSSKPCEGVLPNDEADHAISAILSGLSQNTEYHYSIVVSNSNGSNHTVDKEFITPRTALTGGNSHTARHATFEGIVLPEGEAVTDCVFEYGRAFYGTGHEESVPCVGAIPADEGEHAVTATVTNLLPAENYEYRLAFRTAAGRAIGSANLFETLQQALTGPATEITTSTGTLTGAVRPFGESVTSCVFEYGVEELFGASVPCEGALPADELEHNVTAKITNLVPGKTYHFRVSIQTAGGSTAGFEQTFATEGSVATGEAAAVTASSATLEGTLDPDGSPVERCEFEVGRTIAYGQTVPCDETTGEIGEGTVPVPVSADLTGLVPGTTYHYRLTATNTAGTSRGDDRSFTTAGPRVSEESVVSTEQTEATIRARINPAGAATTYHLEYGPDESYGATTAENAVGSDESNHTVTVVLQSLTPGTTYHYRFVATNPTGVATGADKTFTTKAASAPNTNCPNQAYRSGFSANLPGCRAYELVSPIAKNSGDIKGICQTDCFRAQFDQSSLDGNKLTYGTYKAFEDPAAAPYASQYFASRDAGGWSTEDINPPRDEGLFPEYPNPLFDLNVQFKAFTPDLSMSWVTNDNVKPLTDDASAGNPNLYSRDSATGAYHALTLGGPNPGSLSYISLQGHTPSGDHALFSAGPPLTQQAKDAEVEYALYDYSGGNLEVVSILPNGTPTSGEAGSLPYAANEEREASREHAVSNDGSRIFWSKRGKLYVRIDGERTLPITAGRNQEYFRDASVDGSRMLFETVEAGVGGLGRLYEFDVDGETLSSLAGEEAGVLGASDDLSYIYFVSREDLADGATEGDNNLYLEHEGSLTFITTMADRDLQTYPSAVSLKATQRTTRVTPDGRALAFMSKRSLTGYNNIDAKTGDAIYEVYVYDADEGKLICASCNPTGAQPLGQNLRKPYTATEDSYPEVTAAAWIPSPEFSLYSSRPLSDDGSRLFFNAFDALVPEDTNSRQDVYEWVAGGTAGCKRSDGCVGLISSGESPVKSEFIDADPRGENVFFETKSSLVPQDPGLIDIYDAREGGGFAPPSPPSAGCEGEACQGPISPPVDPSPASAGYRGPGNVAQPGRKKKHQKSKHRKKRHKQQSSKNKAKGGHRANSHRRTAR